MAYQRPPRWKRILVFALTLTLVFVFAPLAMIVVCAVVAILCTLAELGYESPSRTPAELHHRVLP